MASIQFYADDEDYVSILTMLNSDPNVAFIIPDGPRRWIAKWEVNALQDGPYYLWHVSSGSLPLPPEQPFDRPGIIDDPFAGWMGPCTAANPSEPFFGSSPAVVRFCIQRRGMDAPGAIGQSTFGWIGNRYRILGRPASQAMEKWWRKLTRWVSNTATRKVTRWGPLEGPHADIWAFPSAYKKILGGQQRDKNPYF